MLAYRLLCVKSSAISKKMNSERFGAKAIGREGVTVVIFVAARSKETCAQHGVRDRQSVILSSGGESRRSISASSSSLRSQNLSQMQTVREMGQNHTWVCGFPAEVFLFFS